MLDLAQFKGNHLAEIILKFPCPQKVLMVTDGSLDFGTAGFGLSEFVSIVRAGGHTVATAHRSGDSDASITTPFNFATAATPVTTSNYDQIWLFGFSTAPLTPAEQATVVTFMQGGGGVFATGDHSTIGQGMGASLPRVRGMRNWSGVPMSDQNRHDTVIDPGSDNIKQFNDQADAIAQRIYPFFFSNGGPANQASSWAPHPVLQHPSGAVDFLPDHPHESECFAPTPVAGNFAGVEEWPAPAGGGARIAAKVAAVSMSAGRFVTDSGKPPVNPHSFGAISAYDGDAANVGRVVCDATWHHFVNINLNGSGGGVDANGQPRLGLYSGGVATAEYLKIQRYFLNTTRWLAPKNRRYCWPFLVAAVTRFDFELAELQLPIPHPCPWDPLLAIGKVAEDALRRHWGPGAANEILDAMADAGKASPTWRQVLVSTSSQADREAKDASGGSLLPVADLRRAMLGSLINVLVHRLPADRAKLESMLRDGVEDLAQKHFAEGLAAAEKGINEHLGKAMDQTASMVKSILAGA